VNRNRRLAALATVAALATATTVTSAAAADYACTTSSDEIDTPQYSGPWPDNWTFEAKVCARRSGSTVHAYATLRWNAPTSAGQVAMHDLRQ
jgi:hypothetical protein